MEFPNFNFRLDCGDVPEVRQWLKDNGCCWKDNDDLTRIWLDKKYLYVSGRYVTWDNKHAWYTKGARIPLIEPDTKNGTYTYKNTPLDPRTEAVLPSSQESLKTKIKSDGGSSGYYWCEIPLSAVKVDEEKGTVGFMVEEFNEYCLNNDFDASTITKCLKRMGSKEGNTEEYDAKKIVYSANRILNKHKQVPK